MDDLTTYYKTVYHKLGYSMSHSRDTSRVAYLYDFVKKYVPNGGKILDVGCGDQYLSTILTGYEWHGIDLNTEFRKDNLVEHDLMTTPYPYAAQSFDAVVCSEVLEHLWDLRIVHNEVYRLLKPSGTYIMSTPNYDHIDHYLGSFGQLLFDDTKPHLFEHIRQYNYYSHLRFLTRAGFSELEHVGSDAQYSGFFQDARLALQKAFPEMPLVEIDKLLGRMFPKFSHTIMLVSKKV